MKKFRGTFRWKNPKQEDETRETGRTRKARETRQTRKKEGKKDVLEDGDNVVSVKKLH